MARPCSWRSASDSVRGWPRSSLRAATHSRSQSPSGESGKETYLSHLEHQPRSVLRVSVADKLFNARAILRDYLQVGDELWSRFRTGRDGQLWYYRELADRFSRLLPGRMAIELAEVVDELERVTGAPAGQGSR